MNAWLQDSISRMSLSEEAEGYMLSRGLREHRIREIGIVEWDDRRVRSDAPDPEFVHAHKARASRWNGRLLVPLRSPSGALIGCEVRSWRGEKQLSQYLLPQADWNPVFIGMDPSVPRRLCAGGVAWIVEGLFDLAALEHVVPGTDVVLATLRARLSVAHVQFLSRFCRAPVRMAYDNDDTGRRQTYGFKDPSTGRHRRGALDNLALAGVQASPVQYRGGKDFGEIWSSGGVRALQLSIDNLAQ